MRTITDTCIGIVLLFVSFSDGCVHKGPILVDVPYQQASGHPGTEAPGRGGPDSFQGPARQNRFGSGKEVQYLE